MSIGQPLQHSVFGPGRARIAHRLIVLCALVAPACGGAEQPAEAVCAADSDCPFGQICSRSQCVDGCRENGDCGLHTPCIEGACVAATGACSSDFYCDFGERCDLETSRCVAHPAREVLCTEWHMRPRFDASDCPSEADCVGADSETAGWCALCGAAAECRQYETTQTCTSDADCGDYRGGFCYQRPCNGDGVCEEEGLGTCGALFTPRGSPAAQNYSACEKGVCAVAGCEYRDCHAAARQCPRGYSCFDVIDPDALPSCATDSECPEGSTCRTVNEQDGSRFCTCLDDSDCPADTTCRSGACVLYSRCDPELGLTCADVQP